MRYVFTAVAVSIVVGVCGSAFADMSDSFDSYETGDLPEPPWQWEDRYLPPGPPDRPGYAPYTREEAAALGVTITIDQTVFSGSPPGKSVHFWDTSSSAFAQLRRSFGPLSGVVDLTYYMRSDNAEREGVFVTLEGDVGHDHCAAFGNAGGGGHAGWIGILAYWGWPEPEFLPYVEDHWYKVQRSLNTVDNSGSIEVWDVDAYANDPHDYDPSDPTDPDANHRLMSLEGMNNNNVIDLIVMSTGGSQGADCYIDEVSISVVPAPSAALLGVIGLGMVAWIRKRRMA